MKKVVVVVLALLGVTFSANQFLSAETSVHSGGNFTIGLGPVGNFYLTSRRPELDPGLGALVYFDYRWSPELSTATSILMLVQDGTNQDRSENNIVFLGIPTFDVKYYFVNNPSRWDPYAMAGIGYYALTNGTAGRGLASGLGAQLGSGFDFYLSRKISLGANLYFRSIALLGNGSTGNFPLSLDGRFGFHF